MHGQKYKSHIQETYNSFQISCLTGAKADLSNKAGVSVKISDNLASVANTAKMTYLDKWSSRFTWGGDVANKPVEGDLVVIERGRHYFKAAKAVLQFKYFS